MIRSRPTRLLLLASLLVCFPGGGWAGETNSSQEVQAESQEPSLWGQHVRVLSYNWAARFRYIDNGPGAVTSRDLQYHNSLRLRINADPKGRVYFQTRAETGGAFNSSWPNSGAGLKAREWVFNVKSLFVAAEFAPHSEIQGGGIEFDRGAGTEATFADNDGYLMGYRLRFGEQDGSWLFGKLSLTAGYVGDFRKPNFFSRLNRLDETNYFQVQMHKQLTPGGNLEFSSAVTSLEDIRYIRGAVRWKQLGFKIFDGAGLEVVTRATDNKSVGWAVQINKTLDTAGRWKAGARYSDIPLGVFDDAGAQVLWNGDGITIGKRAGFWASFSPIKNFDIAYFGSRQTGSAPNTTRWRGQLMLRYQLAGLFNGLMERQEN